MPDGQTHDDIPAIPAGVAVSDSDGAEVPDVEAPEPVEYEEVTA